MTTATRQTPHVATTSPSETNSKTNPHSAGFLVVTDKHRFAMAMVTLCNLKRTAVFTQAQLEGWYALLNGYRHQTINRAVIELCASQERFPEVSDLLQRCRRIEPPERPYCPNGNPSDRLTRQEIEAFANRLQLEV